MDTVHQNWHFERCYRFKFMASTEDSSLSTGKWFSRAALVWSTNDSIFFSKERLFLLSTEIFCVYASIMVHNHNWNFQCQVMVMCIACSWASGLLDMMPGNPVLRSKVSVDDSKSKTLCNMSVCGVSLWVGEEKRKWKFLVKNFCFKVYNLLCSFGLISRQAFNSWYHLSKYDNRKEKENNQITQLKIISLAHAEISWRNPSTLKLNDMLISYILQSEIFLSYSAVSQPLSRRLLILVLCLQWAQTLVNLSDSTSLSFN